jgi:hypothetical protein
MFGSGVVVFEFFISRVPQNFAIEIAGKVGKSIVRFVRTAQSSYLERTFIALDDNLSILFTPPASDSLKSFQTTYPTLGSAVGIRSGSP